MALTTKGGQKDSLEVSKGFSLRRESFFIELWNEIGEDLGVISDVYLVNNTNGFSNCEIHFKSNGVDKVMYSSDENFKHFIQCAYYVQELNSPLKKYKYSSLNPQHTP